tara:strand:+ start:202 stop:591 length:390 start_codon:yes stop_codon:yes gene_type:complete
MRILMLLAILSINIAQVQKTKNMKLNAGIITHKLVETKAFYTEVLDFGIRFENDFYLLMHTPNESAEISFLLPDHPSQQPIFQPEFNGKGVYLTLEVDNVDAVYKKMKKRKLLLKLNCVKKIGAIAILP